MAAIAAELGTPLMPWQRYVANVALEVDQAGRLVYREVTLTVPRQSGKTTLILALAVQRALAMGGAQRIVYSAQTRLDARKKWEDDHLPVLMASRFRGLVSPRRMYGNEAFIWENGSQHQIVSTTEKAGHGFTIDLAFIDEAFAQDDERLEHAFKPAMITRPQPQLWIVSTAGTEASTYLRAKVDAGRARAQSGVTQGAAYFEWSAPDNADPEDPATWRACMPALCKGGTVTEEAISGEYHSMSLPVFRRAYLNQWLDAIPDEWLVIPRERWDGLRADPVAYGQVALAADVTPRRSSGVVTAAWRRPDGFLDVEVIDHRPGTSWMPGRIGELARKHRPCAVVIDGAGPGGSLIDELEVAGVEVTKPSAREMVQACGQFFDLVMDSGSLRHGGDPVLDAAVAGAVKRDLGDGWAWARKGAAADISPLVSVTLAAWGHGKFGQRRHAPYDILRSVS